MDHLFLLLDKALFVLTLFTFLMFPYSRSDHATYVCWTCYWSWLSCYSLSLFLLYSRLSHSSPSWYSSHVVVIHVFGSLTGFIFLLLRPLVLSQLCLRCFVHVVFFSVTLLSRTPLWLSIVCIALSRSFRACFGSGVFRSLSSLLIGKADSNSSSL
jgi:hypothetical protein